MTNRFVTLICCLFVFSLVCSCENDSDSVTDGDNDTQDTDTETSEDVDKSDIESEKQEVEADKETFPPEKQTPLFKKGLILPLNSLECKPVDADPTKNCNHHGSTIAELADGRIAVVWYHGLAEKSPDSRIVWSTYDPASESWSPVEVIYDDPDLSDGNVAIWVDETGVIYLFFSTIMIGSWDDANIRMIKSEDGGKNWTDHVTLRDEYCWNARHRPIKMTNGEILLPLYQECQALPVFIRSSDNFKTWSEDTYDVGDYFVDHMGQIQPALIRLSDDRISCITRDGTHAHRIQRMISDDFGKTWSVSEALGLPNSGTSVDHVRLLNGHVVVVFNNHPDNRFPLSVALSTDGGLTYTAIRDLNAECPEGNCSYHYPSIMQNEQDGTIWVSYTHKRESIGWVQFNEAWLMQGTEKAQIRCMPHFTCKDEFCFPKCEKVDDCTKDESCQNGACRKSCNEAKDCGEDMDCKDKLCIPKFDPKRVDVLCLPDKEE